MIPVKIKDIDYNVPISWSDISYTKGVEIIELLKQEKQSEALCSLIGLDIEVLNSLKAKDVATLFTLTEFMLDVTIMDSELPKDKYKDIDYGSLPYGDTEAVKIIIKNNKEKNFLELAPQIIKKLTGDDISNEPFNEVIGSVGFFLIQWIIFTKDSMSLTKEKLTKEQNSQELEGSKDSEVLVLG